MHASKDERPLSTLFIDLPDAIARLIHQEMALARAEMSQRMIQLALGVGLLVAASIVLFVALLIVLMGLSELLNEFLPEPLALWLGYLLVGGAALIAGLLLLRRALTNFRDAGRMLERTTGSIQQDFETLRQHLRPEETAPAGDRQPAGAP